MNRVFVLALALLLGACASPMTTDLTPAMVDQFNGGGSAVLITNISGDLACDEAMFGINRAGDSQNQVAVTLRDVGYASSQPAILLVPPGYYSFNRGSCFRAGFYPYEMASTRYWFGGVDLKAGDVVYTGTLDAKLITAQNAPTSLQKFFGALFLSDKDTIDRRFVTYEVVDRSAEVRERLNVTHPDLARKMVMKLLPTYISKDAFAAAVQRAFAPNPDGTPPTAEQADARLPEEIKKIADDAIRTRKADAAAHPSPAPAN